MPLLLPTLSQTFAPALDKKFLKNNKIGSSRRRAASLRPPAFSLHRGVRGIVVIVVYGSVYIQYCVGNETLVRVTRCSELSGVVRPQSGVLRVDSTRDDRCSVNAEQGYT